MTVHDFRASLTKAHRDAAAGWWEVVYRRFFPTLLSMTSVVHDGLAQRAGIDRIIVLQSGRIVYVDEKVREAHYEDILLEVWSDVDRRTGGWIQKELWADYIAYAVPPVERCYMLPVGPLQTAWQRHGADWTRRYRTVRAQNHGWITESIAVPYDALFSALDAEWHVSWGARLPGMDP